MYSNKQQEQKEFVREVPLLILTGFVVGMEGRRGCACEPRNPTPLEFQMCGHPSNSLKPRY